MRSRLDIPEFYAPLPLFAVAVLGANDAYGKALFHNAFTGKLSDFAGCFVLPLFVSALLGIATRMHAWARLSCGALATVALFGSIKLSQPAADAVCGVMDGVGRWVGTACGRILADPTDLAALPLVALAVAYGLRRTGAIRVDQRPEPQGADR